MSLATKTMKALVKSRAERGLWLENVPEPEYVFYRIGFPHNAQRGAISRIGAHAITDGRGARGDGQQSVLPQHESDWNLGLGQGECREHRVIRRASDASDRELQNERLVRKNEALQANSGVLAVTREDDASVRGPLGARACGHNLHDSHDLKIRSPRGGVELAVFAGVGVALKFVRAWTWREAWLVGLCCTWGRMFARGSRGTAARQQEERCTGGFYHKECSLSVVYGLRN